jgi:hypothetical protein
MQREDRMNLNPDHHQMVRETNQSACGFFMVACKNLAVPKRPANNPLQRAH